MYVIDGKEFTAEEVQTLVKAGALTLGQKHDPASTTLDASTLHGTFPGNSAQYGIFSTPEPRPQRFSALTRPDSFMGVLALRKSEFDDNIREIQTGQTAGGTTNVSSWCGDPPTPGDLKVMRITNAWGKYKVKTRLNALEEIGGLRNRSDVPAEILNAGPRANPLIPEIMYRIMPTRSQLRHELYKVGVDMERNTETVAIVGTAGVDNSRTGWWAEFGGLDGQIKTGYTDSVTGLAAPAADSVVETFNAAVTGTDANSRTIVEAITDMVYALRDRADGVGMGGVDWVIVMRKEAFRSVVDNFACSYATYRCAGSATSPNNRDGMEIQRLRIEMMNGRYLLVDGVPVPVRFSEGITSETLANQQYMSDMYMVPLNWMGMPLTFLEYFDMGNPYSQEYSAFINGDGARVLNDGLFLATERTTGSCPEYHFSAKLRLVMETPFLAGRLDNLKYNYYAQTRTAVPGTSWYQDGGVTYRS